MNKQWKRIKRILTLAIMLVFTAIPCTAFAADAGSLQIVLKKGGTQVVLYPVASAEGVLNSDFAEVGISSDFLMKDQNGRKNAKKLYQHAVSAEIDGVTHTTDSNGVTHYTNLAKGIYLIADADNENDAFEPFLVKVPTVINGEARYYLKATPKSVTPGGSSDEKEKPGDELSEPEIPKDPAVDIPDPEAPAGTDDSQNPLEPIPDPNVPSHVLEMDEPIIPQTGMVRYPIWFLNGFGALFILVGIFQLRKGNLEDFEQDEEDLLDEEA